ncbi:MAG: cyclic nucleotide-binding domain-containing protein [Oligoflexia bacterium]|nr:cyclic nucleotide-binding domain-containing protein [Oligoflexia bacterium]
MQHFEVVIIGAGPAGLGAALNAAHHKLSHLLIEKNEIGNTVFEYQLRKHVMAEPGRLPLRAHLEFTAGSREQILDKWNSGVRQKGVNLLKASVSKIERQGERFLVSYSGGECSASHVVLAIGVQGSPRKLGVPGEELPHVAYTLSDPEAFHGKHITVVGAGDAAIENALALVEKNTVTIINRGAEFARAKDANNAAICKAIENKKLVCVYNAEVAKIEAGRIFISSAEGALDLPCDHVIARIGAVMPRKFLEQCGIKFPNSEANSVPVTNARFESSVPGLYVIGALIGYPLIKQAINQGHEVIQHIIKQPLEPADQPLLAERLVSLGSDVPVALQSIRDALPLFKDLTEPQFRELILESTIHIKKAGDLVFAINDYTDSFFSVIRGQAGIELPNGKTIPVSAGNFFGEMGLLSGRRRSATVRALGDCVLLESPRRQLIKLMSSIDQLKREIDRKFLRNALETSIFPGVESELLCELAEQSRFKSYRKGEVIFREGEIGTELVVIRKGSVKVSRRDRSGAEVTQAYIAAGNYVGEMALLSDAETPRSATVTAAVGCDTVIVDKQSFRGLLTKSKAAQDRVRTLADARKVENLTLMQDPGKGRLLDFIISQGITDADNVLVIDSDLCVACDNCEHACAATHGGYSRLDRKGGLSFASIQVPISCRHCENPLCMTDCPPDALVRKPNGEVVILDSCIGCGNCTRNCPYGVISMIYPGGGRGDFSLLQFLGLRSRPAAATGGQAKAGKCDMCEQLGGGPACVRACPTGAAMRVNPAKLVQLVSPRERR